LTPYADQKGILLLQLIIEGVILRNRDPKTKEAELDELVAVALEVLAAHPELISQNRALATVVSQLAVRLGPSHFTEPNWFPQLLRITLRITAQHADLIVLAEQSTPRYLAAEALADILLALHGENMTGSWRPHLTPERLLGTAELVLDRLLKQPNWLLLLNGGHSLWRDTIQTTLASFSQIPAGQRLAPATLELVIWNVLRAVLANQQLLQNIKWTSDEHEKKFLSHLLDLVVSFVYPDGSSGPERTVLLENVLLFTIEDVLDRHPDKKGLLLLDMVLSTYEHNHEQPFNREQAQHLLEAGYAIIAAHPELITEEEVFQKMIRDLANTLDSGHIPLEHLLPEILRLSLRIAAGDLGVLMRIKPGSPRILLAVALEQALRVLTKPGHINPWRPQFTEGDLLRVLEVVLLEVKQHPNWVKEKFIELTLSSILDGVEAARLDRPLPLSTIMVLFREGMAAVRLRRQLVIDFADEDGEQNELVLEFALRELIVSINGPDASSGAQWTLAQAELFDAIAKAYLARLAYGPAEEGLVRQLIQEIELAAEQLDNNLAWTIEDLLAHLRNV
ncbi:MAG: hypothetical protein AAFQ37_07280, partial [Bacteroidota bacterium]